MSLKISLDEKATESVHAMLAKLKETNPDCGASPSGLVSWILVQFAEKHFDKSKTKIASHFFNPKAYLRHKLKDIDSPKKLEVMLTEVRARLRASIDKNQSEESHLSRNSKINTDEMEK